jgi:hypothetical protein
MNANGGAGAFCLVVAGMWTVDFVGGVWMLKETVSYYRQSGMTVDQAKQQAARAAVQASV